MPNYKNIAKHITVNIEGALLLLTCSKVVFNGFSRLELTSVNRCSSFLEFLVIKLCENENMET